MSFTYKIGYGYYGQYLRKSLCLTSYFRKPEYGVVGWEELSRSSSFFVRSAMSSKKFHIITAAHVTSPFHFPKLYPYQFEQFLQFLNQNDTKCVIQVREFDSGRVLEEFPLMNKVWCNIDTDVSIVHLENEEETYDTLKRKYNIDVEPLTLVGDEIVPSINTMVRLIGHDYTQIEGQELLIPASLDGKIKGEVPTGRYIVSTKQPSVMGLCGGPAVLLDTENSLDKCIGMVEARINVNRQQTQDWSQEKLANLEDTTLIVKSNEIRKFISEVEEKFDTAI